MDTDDRHDEWQSNNDDSVNKEECQSIRTDSEATQMSKNLRSPQLIHHQGPVKTSNIILKQTRFHHHHLYIDQKTASVQLHIVQDPTKTRIILTIQQGKL